jgi:hypothetical protein
VPVKPSSADQALKMTGALKAAEKLHGEVKKRQGTTSAVPVKPSSADQALKMTGALKAAENSVRMARSVRARLQSCRKCRKINVGFSPCGVLLGFSPIPKGFSAPCLAPERNTSNLPPEI